MRFISVEVSNFRQYEGHQKIDFPESDTKNFVIVLGSNGSGKTNFLSSVVWCFYGEEGSPFMQSKNEKRQGILNEHMLESISVGKTAIVSVEVVLGEKMPEIILKRQATFKKDDEGHAIQIQKNFEIFKRGPGGMNNLPNTLIAMNNILPKEVKDFFFFDGEKLDNFFKQGTGQNIQTAVINVSQIGLLELTGNRLEAVMREVMRTSKDLSPESTSIEGEISAFEESIKTLESDITKSQKEVSGANDKVASIDKFLKEHSLPLAREMQRRRESLILQSKEIDSAILRLHKKEAGLIIKYAPLSFLCDVCNSLVYRIDKLTEEGKIPPDIKPDFLKKLLKKGKCICGNEIGKHEKELINKLYDNVSMNYGENADLWQEGRSELANSIRTINRFKEDLEDIHKSINDNNMKEKKISEDLEEIEIKLRGVDIEEIAKKEEERSMLWGAIQKQMSQLGAYEQSLQHVRGRKSIREREQKDLFEKQEKNKYLKKEVDFYDESIQLLKEVHDNIVEDVRMQTEKFTEEYFFSLIWNKSNFKKIKIDDKYTISIFNQYDAECLNTLSSGQRQILALSFMAALKKVSGFNIPVIIDTPLGRISGQPRENIAKNLPEYLKNTQVVMLVTDTEYDDEFKDKIRSRVGAEFSIMLDKDTGSSS